VKGEVKLDPGPLNLIHAMNCALNTDRGMVTRWNSLQHADVVESALETCNHSAQRADVNGRALISY